MSSDSGSAPFYTPLSAHPPTAQAGIYVGLVIDAVLDVDVLREKAEELLQRWPILGSKVVFKGFPSIPSALSPGTDLNFAARHIDTDLQTAFPFSFDFSTASTAPSYHSQTNPNSTDSLFHFANSIRTLHLPPETLFALRVTTLKDATLLGIRTSHHFADGQATFDIVTALAAVVNGSSINDLVLPPDAVVPMSNLVCGVDTEDADDENIQSLPEILYPLGAFPLLKFALPIMLQSLFQGVGFVEPFEEKYVHLSATLVANMQKEYQDVLEADAVEGAFVRSAKLKISKNDVITAWIAKNVFASFPPSQQPIYLYCVLDYRDALPSRPENTIWLHNSHLDFFPALGQLSTLQKLHPAFAALAIRRATLKAKHPRAIKRALEYFEAHQLDVGSPAPTEMNVRNTLFPFSYVRLAYCGLGFEGAIAKGESGTGKVVFWCPATDAPGGLKPNPAAMIMSDGKEGYWVRVVHWKSGWETFKMG